MRTIYDMDPNGAEFRSALAELLRQIDPKLPLGTDLFNAVARVSSGIAFEAALFHSLGDGRIQVYLRRRGHDDTAFPGEWHIPGSFFRPGEKNRDVADRLQGEFGVAISEFAWVNWTPFPDDERGSGISQIFLVEPDGDVRLDDRHGWFDVEGLPEVTVHSHRNYIIPLALAAYRLRNPT